jgi:hypothetical protein
MKHIFSIRKVETFVALELWWAKELNGVESIRYVRVMMVVFGLLGLMYDIYIRILITIRKLAPSFLNSLSENRMK